MRALLVEDDDTIAGFVERGLREAGFAVDRFADGESGLLAAIGQPYDVAIVDIMLPKRDGLSLIDELRKRGIPAELRLGVRKVDDDFSAHAWIECAGRTLLDGGVSLADGPARASGGAAGRRRLPAGRDPRAADPA